MIAFAPAIFAAAQVAGNAPPKGLGYVAAILLGVLQGLCEFLPISSSGHLVVAQHVLGYSAADAVPMFFDVMLHVGTLIAVVVYYRRRLAGHLTQCVDGGASLVRHGGIAQLYATNEGLRLGALCAVASIPIVAVALAFHDDIEAAFTRPLWVAVALLVTAGILLAAHRFSNGRCDLLHTGLGTALAVGIAQAVALVPGISRSGSTLAVALVLGLSTAWAVEFVMMISIPAILAAALYSALKGDPRWLVVDNLLPTFVGLLISAVVGYAALGWLVRAATHHRLRWFSLYLLLVGTSLITVKLLGGI